MIYKPTMTQSTRRSILRWTHILFGLPIIGFVYGPPTEVAPYRPMFQFVFLPVVILSGLWMWKGDLIRRLVWKR